MAAVEQVVVYAMANDISIARILLWAAVSFACMAIATWGGWL